MAYYSSESLFMVRLRASIALHDRGDTMNDPAQLHVVRSPEEMLEFISDLNRKIVQNADVPDSDIQKAIMYQRDLNVHNLEKKPRKTTVKNPKEPLQRIKLEDL